MKKRILVAFIMILCLCGVFAFRLLDVFGLYIFDLFISIISIFCSLELSKLFSIQNKAVNGLLIGIYPSFVFLGHVLFFAFDLDFYFYIIIQLIILILNILFAFIVNLKNFNKDKSSLKKNFKNCLFITGNSAFIFIYPNLFLLSLMLLNHIDYINNSNIQLFNGDLGWLVLVMAFIIPIITDSFAMFGGKIFKGPKLCSKISPNKTISGAVCGSVFSSLVCGALYFLFNSFKNYNNAFKALNIQVWQFIILGLFGAIICQLGDIFESYLKRKANIKDSGNIFPGHGGFLDRFDSHIFNAPFILIFFSLLIIA